MIPCKDCCGETKVIGVTYGYIARDKPYVRRRHECKECKTRFSTKAQVVYEADPEECSELGGKLKQKLKELGITQADFARRMRVDERTIRNWNKRIPAERVNDVKNFLIENKMYAKNRK
jgi:transcriptional regulator NrdR family protein